MHLFVYAVIVFMVFAFCINSMEIKSACMQRYARCRCCCRLLFWPLLVNASLLLLHNNKCKPWWWMKKETNTRIRSYVCVEIYRHRCYCKLTYTESQSVHCFRTLYEMFSRFKWRIKKNQHTNSFMHFSFSILSVCALSCLVEQIQMHTKKVERLLLRWLLLLLLLFFLLLSRTQSFQEFWLHSRIEAIRKSWM